MFIKILYVLLVLGMIALIGAVGAAYLKIRKHMHEESEKASKNAIEDKTHTGTPSGS